jgi:iron complex transport system ATP-binding protein
VIAQAPPASAPQAAITPLLCVQGATARVPGRTFGPFDLRVRPAERIALVGPSGAGKTTLLRLIAGERAAASGTVHLDGQAPSTLGLATLARRRAVLPQSHAVAFGLPVELIVTLGRFAVEPDPDRAPIAAAALALARASHLADRRFDTLSGGEQARVQLARVFAQLWDVHAGLLLVDEPLAALDPGLQIDLLEALGDFCRERGHALVAIVHDLNQALGGFERLWLVRDGQLVADLPADRRAVPSLASLFEVNLRVIEDADGRFAVLPGRAARHPDAA